MPASLAVGGEAASPSLTASSPTGTGGRAGVDGSYTGVQSLTLTAELLADIDLISLYRIIIENHLK